MKVLYISISHLKTVDLLRLSYRQRTQPEVQYFIFVIHLNKQGKWKATTTQTFNIPTYPSGPLILDAFSNSAQVSPSPAQAAARSTT